MRFGAMLFAALAAAGAAGASGALAGDAANRVDLAGAAFKPLTLRAPPAAKTKAPVLYVEAFIPGRGLVRWAAPAAETGRLAPLTPPAATSPTDNADLAYARDWPSALHDLETGRSNVALRASAFAAPAGPDGRGLEIGPAYGAPKRTDVLGVRNGSTYGDAGRWLLFAALRDRAIGWSVVGAGPDGAQGSLSDDKGGFVGQAQAGLGYRRGPLQASLGYVYERVRFETFGLRSRVDNRFGLTVSWRTGMAPAKATPSP